MRARRVDVLLIGDKVDAEALESELEPTAEVLERALAGDVVETLYETENSTETVQ